MKQLSARGEANRAMPDGVYAALTCNLGPCTVCLDPTKCLNYSGIPCVITRFGDCDPEEGGNLFLSHFGLRIGYRINSTMSASSNTSLPAATSPVVLSKASISDSEKEQKQKATAKKATNALFMARIAEERRGIYNTAPDMALELNR
ncbi:unnamed protein product [Peniophora sp. CBMAI 1063]|nr:unnamed protein product [Peniophora sp. CBMAI 1063]